MRILILFIILSFLMIAPPAAAPLTESDDEYTVGIITLSPPEYYVVVEEIKTKGKRIYQKDTYDEAVHKDSKLLESILLDTIEYRYRPVKGELKFISEEFELIGIEKRRAILKRDYIERPREAVEERMEALKEVIEIEKEAVEEEPKKEPDAKRLVAELFFKIESKKIGEHEWEVSLSTIMDAAANFGNVLKTVIKMIDDLRKPEKKSKVYFSTSLGKASLGPSGLLVESLNSGLKAKCGIKDDDLIKTINGKGLSSIQDAAAIFSTFTASPQTVTVKLIRDDTDLTLTYYIK